MPRLVSVWFENPSRDASWSRLARVLAYTAAQHCPTWSREIALAPVEPKRLTVRDAFWANTVKLDAWTRIVETAAEGDAIAIVDTDTFLTGPLDEIWAQPFDLALTRRRSGPFPYNAGVVFVRVNDRSRRFFRAWAAENRAMLTDPARHLPWKQKYGGINQAALGCLLEQPHEAATLDVPCTIWNCEDESWPLFDPARTRLVHVKSALRLALFQHGPLSRTLVPLVSQWRSLEAAATPAPVRRRARVG